MATPPSQNYLFQYQLQVPKVVSENLSPLEILHLAYNKAEKGNVALLFIIEPETLLKEPLITMSSLGSELGGLALNLSDIVVNSYVVINGSQGYRKIKVVSVLKGNPVSKEILLTHYLAPGDIAILPRSVNLPDRFGASIFKEIHIIGGAPLKTSLFPKVPANLIGPTRLTELRSTKYDLNIGILGESHILQPVCRKTASYVYPDEYLRDYIIPSFTGDTLDIYIEGDISSLRNSLGVQRRLEHLKEAGCPFTTESERTCQGYNLVALRNFVLNLKKSRLPGVRGHFSDFRHSELGNLPLFRDYEYVMYGLREFGYPAEGFPEGEVKADLEGLTGKIINLIEQLPKVPEHPELFIYKYQKEVAAIENKELRAKYEEFLRSILRPEMKEIIKGLQYIVSDIVGFQKYQIQGSSFVSYMSWPWVQSIDFYNLARMLRSYTKPGKEGPKARNIISYSGKAHGDFYVEFFVTVLGCEITRDLSSEIKGINYQCLYLGE